MPQPTEPSFSHVGPFQFETQYRGGPPEREGPTLKVFVKDADDWKLVMRFDCTRERPHWHETFKGGPQKIMFWSNTDMEEAVGLATAEVKSSFIAKLEKLGYAEEAAAARDASVQSILGEQCDKLHAYMSN
jgi:hypothetical protein